MKACGAGFDGGSLSNAIGEVRIARCSEGHWEREGGGAVDPGSGACFGVEQEPGRNGGVLADGFHEGFVALWILAVANKQITADLQIARADKDVVDLGADDELADFFLNGKARDCLFDPVRILGTERRDVGKVGGIVVRGQIGEIIVCINGFYAAKIDLVFF